jgi:hypothetical protein
MLVATIPAAGILAFAILDSPSPYPYNRDVPQGAPGGLGAQVAQLVEHCTENAGVGGSIPPLGTIRSNQR